MAIFAACKIMSRKCCDTVTDPIRFAACRDREPGTAVPATAADALQKDSTWLRAMNGERVFCLFLAPVATWRQIVVRTLVVLIPCEWHAATLASKFEQLSWHALHHHAQKFKRLVSRSGYIFRERPFSALSQAPLGAVSSGKK